MGLLGRDSEVLFHELLHVYQRIQGAHLSNEEWNSYALNREIEAWCAEFMYLPEENRDIWQRNAIREMGAAASYLAKQVNARGEPIDYDAFKIAMSSLRGALGRNGYSDMSFDEGIIPLDNLKNIREIAKGCKTIEELAQGNTW